jgi:hypothetical protein
MTAHFSGFVHVSGKRQFAWPQLFPLIINSLFCYLIYKNIVYVLTLFYCNNIEFILILLMSITVLLVFIAVLLVFITVF